MNRQALYLCWRNSDHERGEEGLYTLCGVAIKDLGGGRTDDCHPI
jgi:hypothetical protein